jgi:hypothetical protein
MSLSLKLMSAVIFLYTFFQLSALSSADLIAPTRALDGQKEAMGTLTVFSEPPGLNVKLDGTEIGITPVISKEVKPGSHILRVKKSETKIYIQPGMTLQLSWFKGSFIEIPVKEEIPKQQKAETPKLRQKKKTKEPSDKEEDLQPLYWPLNPRGPIY